jgi:hypothetical protein
MTDVAGPRPRPRWRTFDYVLAGLVAGVVVSLALKSPRRAATCSRCDSCSPRTAKGRCKCGDAV